MTTPTKSKTTATRTSEVDSAAIAREQARQHPRRFRAEINVGEMLAMRPEAVEFSYLYTGCVANSRTKSNVAIVTINGPLEHHATFWWDSYESILQRVEDAMQGVDIVKEHEARTRVMNWGDLPEEYAPIEPVIPVAVVLCVDSPGGEAAGATYAHRRLRRLRKLYDVPLYAYANETACSAAYELACAADEIWLPDTGTVGSIGVIATMFDRTRQNEKIGLNIELVTSGELKADGHADRPLTDEVLARMQTRVYQLANVFWGVVAKSRGTNAKSVAALEAGVFTGQDAVDVGIADGVCGWSKFLTIVANSADPSAATQV